jgi:uncharacterized protein YhfF
MTSNVEHYWRQFLASLPLDVEPPAYVPASFFFGSNPEDAPAITPLVLSSVKTATGSLKWTYDNEGTIPPQPGDLSVVTNGGDDPVCIIETLDVQVIPFEEVGEEWAFHGGEGDRTLTSWRVSYWEYIVNECARLGREPHRRVPLVMERFRVVYDEPLRAGLENVIEKR